LWAAKALPAVEMTTFVGGKSAACGRDDNVCGRQGLHEWERGQGLVAWAPAAAATEMGVTTGTAAPTISVMEAPL